MKNRRILICGIAALAGMFGLVAWSWSDDKPAAAAPAMDDAAMKAWAEASTPGPHHKALEAMAGKFKYVSKFRMDPAGEWMSYEGEYEGTMILGGRYLQGVNRGTMMGSPFEGIGCIGYDNVSGKHIATWMDNMGTGIMFSQGSCEDNCRTLTLAGEMLDPMTRKMTKYKYTYEVASNDQFSMRMWCANPADGSLYECMNVAATRAK